MFASLDDLLQDLKSSNHVDVWAALCSVSQLVNTETLAAILDPVVALLSHKQ